VGQNGSLVVAALKYAAAGFPVLPLHTGLPGGRCSCAARSCDRPGKHPRWRPGLITAGLREATTDPGRLREWWDTWPTANVGLVTGVIADVCDVDSAEGARLLHELIGPEWSDLPAVRTGSGGLHLYVAATGHPGHVRLLSGVDWRGSGGYVVAPPSRHASGARYRWVRGLGGPLPPCPPELLALLAPAPPAPAAVPADRRVRHPDRYAAAALDNEAVRVRQAPVGERNTTLYRAARSLGRLAGRGLLAPAEAAAVLTRAALAAGLGVAEIRRTIRSGLSAARR
jgi:hypothetical protein